MDYSACCNRLIERAENRMLAGYSEKHHVVPRCVDKSSTYVVRLTPEEHYVVHQLLTRIHPGNKGLIYAAVRMTQGTNNGSRNNKMYGWLRREWMKVITQPWSETRRTAQTPEVNEKIAAGHRGKPAHNKGKTASLEARANMSHPRSEEGRAAMRGIPKSEEHKARLSEAAKAYATLHPGHKATPEAVARMIEVQNHPDVKARNIAAHKGIKRSPEAVANCTIAQNRPEVRARNSEMQLARSAENSAAQIAAWARKNADPDVKAAISLQRRSSALLSHARRRAERVSA